MGKGRAFLEHTRSLCCVVVHLGSHGRSEPVDAAMGWEQLPSLKANKRGGFLRVPLTIHLPRRGFVESGAELGYPVLLQVALGQIRMPPTCARGKRICAKQPCHHAGAGRSNRKLPIRRQPSSLEGIEEGGNKDNGLSGSE